MAINEDKGLVRFFITLAIILFITYGLSNLIGTSRTGFEERDRKEIKRN